MSGNGTISVSAGQTSTFSGQIGGYGSLNVNGAGTLILGYANNTYSGTTTVTNGGTLSVSNGFSLSTGNITLAGSTLQSTGTVNVFGGVSISNGATLNVLNSGNSATLESITGTGGLNITGSGTVILNGASSYTGGTTVTGATVSAYTDYDFGDASGTITLNGGTIQSNSLSTARAITLGTNGGTIVSSATLSGTISGGGGLTVTGGGTLYLGSTSNTYSGGTVVTGASGLAFASDADLGTGGLTLNNGSLLFSNGPGTNNISQTITLGPSGGTISVQNSFSPVVISGQVTGTGSLTIGGFGNEPVVLSSGNNNYTGGTVLGYQGLGGILTLQNGTTGSATGSGSLTVSSNSQIGGAGTSNSSSFAIQGVAIVGNGTDTTSQLTLTGSTASSFTQARLTFDLGVGAAQGQSNQLNLGSTPVTFNNTSVDLTPFSADPLIQAGTIYTLITTNAPINAASDGLTLGTDGQIVGGLSIGADSYFGASSDGYSSGIYSGSYLFVNGDDIDVDVVPEPGTWALISAGLAILGIHFRVKGRRII